MVEEIKKRKSEKQYTISRHVNGITLNPKQYLMTSNCVIQRFALTDALGLIGAESIEDAEERCGVFIEPVEDVA